MKKSQKKEREKRRSRFIFVWFLLLSAGIFATTIYAWFSSDLKVNINSIDIHIETMAGVQVSTNGINWSNTVTLEDIVNAEKTYPNANNQIPETLGGCSTDGRASGATMDMYYGSTRERTKDMFYLVASKQTEINCYGDEECQGRRFIAFDLFVLLNENSNLSITGESYVKNISEYVEGGENSARIAFVNLGTTSDTVNSAQAQYLANASESIIWEPNYDTHTATGVANAANVYGLYTTQTGAARLPYRGINQEIKTPGVLITETNNSPYFSPVYPKITTIKGFTDDQELMSLPKGVTKLRIYFWLEGQDVDMENEISGGELEFKLEIVVK